MSGATTPAGPAYPFVKVTLEDPNSIPAFAPSRGSMVEGDPRAAELVAAGWKVVDRWAVVGPRRTCRLPIDGEAPEGYNDRVRFARSVAAHFGTTDLGGLIEETTVVEADWCGDHGPRVGEDVTVCVLVSGHGGRHQAHASHGRGRNAITWARL